MTELPQFLHGGWKVLLAVKQYYQPLYTVRNRGGGVILSKKTSQLKWRGPKKKTRVFMRNSKIHYCGPTSAARELKQEVNVRTTAFFAFVRFFKVS